MDMRPAEILARLVRIPSVNPMGRPAADVDFHEARLTEQLESMLGALGLPMRRVPVAPGRDNLLAWLEGDPPPERGGRVVLFDAHQDTVPTDGMTIDPFAAEVRDGRLYGRGACDTKGGMAAMLAAVARWAGARRPATPTVVLAFTVNEEYGFDGARRLVSTWLGSASERGESPPGEPPWPPRPDVAVVAEPTDLDVVIAHKGVVRWRCHAGGRAAHSSSPESGDNAVYRMARALIAIERYAAHELPARPKHALCGGPTLSVGTIHGGASVNVVPDRCTIEIDRRLAPGEGASEARRELIERVAAAGHGDAIEHETPYMEGPPLSNEHNGPLAERLAACVEAATGRPCARRGAAYATNGAFYAAAGIPTVVFGPGSIAQAHTADEWVALEQVEQAAEIFHEFCGGV